MKKPCLLWLMSLLLFVPVVHAESEGRSHICRQQIEKRDREYAQKVLKDVLHSFDMQVKLDEPDTVLIGAEDFKKALFLFGKSNPLYESLNEMFHTGTAYRGMKVLLFADGNPAQAYLLYKEQDGTNVMVILKRTEKKWKAIEKRTQKGKHIPYILVPCEEAGNN
ncbi:MAG: hypothetical protein ACE3JP_10695 [Ectobacillus sp.]